MKGLHPETGAGKSEVPTNLVYPHSKNNPVYFEERTATTLPRIVSTDLQGTIHYTYLDGTTETAVIKEFGSDHFFLAANLVGADAYEYIFAQGNNLEIYDNNLKPLLVKHFDHPISHMPNLYQFSNNEKKIGLVAQSASLIYLLNVDGSLHEGFPLIGHLRSASDLFPKTVQTLTFWSGWPMAIFTIITLNKLHPRKKKPKKHIK